MDSETKFPKIDFRGLEQSKAGTEAWNATHAKVMEALDTAGFFTVVFDGVSDEDLDELFSSVGDSLCGAPLELKMKLVSDKPFQGYIPSMDGYIEGYKNIYESFDIREPHHLESVQAFTDQLWPSKGNPKICDALWSYCKKSYELDLIIKRMILEGLGIAEHFSSLVEPTLIEFRFNKIGLPENGMSALRSHKDQNIVNILYQHHHQALEVLNKSGEWFYVPPKTYTILIGESFEAWSNGRIKATTHQVRMTKNVIRYSLGFGSQFKEGFIIEAPKELVDDEHPKLFKPFDYISYLSFYVSEKEAAKDKDTLKAYCGVNGDEIEA